MKITRARYDRVLAERNEYRRVLVLWREADDAPTDTAKMREARAARKAALRNGGVKVSKSDERGLT